MRIGKDWLHRSRRPVVWVDCVKEAMLRYKVVTKTCGEAALEAEVLRRTRAGRVAAMAVSSGRMVNADLHT